MRALFVTHNFPRSPGDAAGSFVLRLAVALQRAGHDIRVLAPRAPGLAPYDVIDDIPVARIAYAAPERETLAYTGTMAEAVRASWSARFALLGMIRALGRASRAWINGLGEPGWTPDLVHAHWWFPAGLAVTTPTSPTRPLVITMHGSDVRLARTLPGGGRLAKRVLGRAVVRTAVSRWLGTQAEALGGGAVETAPMPIDTTRFTVDPTITADPAHVLFVGRLNAQKGVHFALAAFARLPGHVRLTLCGDGPDRAALEAQAQALGIAGRVSWHPTVTQPALAELYRRATLVVMPSIGEGLGLVGVEAQACGTPVVGFASGGLLDVVPPGDHGLLVPPGDVEALAGAMGRLLADPAQRAARAADGLAHVAERFAPQTVAARYAALYARAVDR